MNKFFQSSPPKYFPFLDFLRGLAAIVILFWHYHHFYLSDADLGLIWEYERQPFYKPLYIFYNYGFYAVQFFWLLSGFVFAFVYKLRKPSIYNFFILRFSRLWPLHYFTLMVVLITQIISYKLLGYYLVIGNIDLKHFILNLFYAQYWGFEDGYSFNSPSWSVSVEEIVYWVFFLIAVLFKKSNLKMYAIITFISVFFLSKSLIIASIFYFFLGACVYEIQKHLNNFNEYLKAILYLFLLIISIYLFDNYIYNFRTENLGLGLVFSLVILFGTLIDKLIFFKKYNSIFISIGSITYSSYLIHFPIQLIVLLIFEYFNFSKSIFDEGFTLVFFVVFILTISRIVYLKIERPLQKFIRTKYVNLKTPH